MKYSHLQKLVEPKLDSLTDTLRRDYRQALNSDDLGTVEAFLRRLEDTAVYYSQRGGSNPGNAPKNHHGRSNEELDSGREKVLAALEQYGDNDPFMARDISKTTGISPTRVSKYLSRNSKKLRLNYNSGTRQWAKKKSYSPDEVREMVSGSMDKGAYDSLELSEMTGYTQRSISTFRRHIEAAKKKE